MTNNYNEEMFEFMTSKDNFELVSNIYEQYGDIKDKLLTEFWKLVIEKVKSCAEAKWKVGTYEEIKFDDSAVWLSKENHKAPLSLDDYVWVSFENLKGRVYVHLARNIHYIDPGNEYLTQLLSEIKNYDKPRGTIKDELCWKYTGDDFSTSTSLKKILPYNRELLADSYANLIIDLAKDLEIAMDRLAKLPSNT